MGTKLDGHATRTDRSAETGTLVVCTCGLVLGPMSHERAIAAARDHRKRVHTLSR